MAVSISTMKSNTRSQKILDVQGQVILAHNALMKVRLPEFPELPEMLIRSIDRQISELIGSLSTIQSIIENADKTNEN